MIGLSHTARQRRMVGLVFVAAYGATTFTATPSVNPADRIDVEVGDAQQPTFFPQVKVKRWGNEANVSIRLEDAGAATPVVTPGPDRVRWTKGSLIADWYNVPPNTEHPEGASEFDISLLAKPPTNVLVFSIVSANVEFDFQPLLTNVDPDGSSWEPSPKGVGRIVRAAGVGGGYAVYHAAPPPNIEGGKLYRSGKIGMIFRPKLIDAVGATVWADLLIAADQLTVTIPQAFLDTATYPIRHAAGLTFGYTTLGGSSDCDSGGEWVVYCQLDATSPAGTNTDTNHSWGIPNTECSPISGTIRMALYNQSASLPSAKQVEDGSDTSVSLNVFVTGPAVSFALAASTQYWLAYVHVTGASGTRWDTGGTKAIRYQSGTTLPATASGTSSLATNTHPSAYVTYTAAGGDTSRTPLVGAAALAGLAGRMDFGILVPTEV